MCLKHGLQICLLQCAQRFFWIYKADLYPGLPLQPSCLLALLTCGSGLILLYWFMCHHLRISKA